MAFVYSQPRWSPPKNNLTPGPGSHFPQYSNCKSDLKEKKKICKGITYIKTKNKNDSVDEQAEIQPFYNNNIYSVEQKSKQNKNIKIAIKHPEYLKVREKMIYNKQSFSSDTLQIKSINTGKVIIFDDKQNKKIVDKYEKTEKSEDQSFDLQNIMMKKTNPSIKQTYHENFYIGSKEEQQGKNIKNSKSYSKSTNRIKKGKKRIYSSVKKMQNSEIIASVSHIEYEGQLTVVKPLTAPHNSRKKQQLFQSQTYKYEQKSTGIQQQDDSQFIDDAVPGPGSYEVRANVQTTKKGLMFTEKNKNRFQDTSNPNQGLQFIYDYKLNGSKPMSRASQFRVAFGSAINNFRKNQNKMKYQTDFYQNFMNIESKCTKIKLKDALNPGFFTSKVPRFIHPTKQSLWREDDECNQELNQKKTKNLEKQNKTTHPFNSVVDRYNQKQKLTSKIDYNGQKYKTIQQNIQAIINQSRYYQSIERDPEYDHESEEKNKEQSLKRVKSDIQIKNHLIEDIYGFRQRQNKNRKKNQIKAYTFSPKEQKIISKENNSPCPAQYYKEKDWIKSTFNLKFIDNQFEKKGNKKTKQSNTKVHESKRDQEIKMLRI